MRLRHLIPVLLLAFGALLVPACGGDDGETASATSDDTESTDSGSDSSDSSDSDSTDDIPDPSELDDLVDEIPGLDDELGDCLSQAAAFSSLYFEALGGEDGAKEAQRKAEELKDLLPDDLHDDIDVISEAIGQVAEEGLLSGTDAMETDEFNTATDNINAYFEDECGALG